MIAQHLDQELIASLFQADIYAPKGEFVFHII
jgi:hypothetical protein